MIEASTIFSKNPYKDNQIQKQSQINPQFDNLNDPLIFKRHVEEITKKPESTPHEEILTQLIDQIIPVDFEELVFPDVIKFRNQLKDLEPESEEAKGIRKRLEKIKINTKHYLVLSIVNVLKVAKRNHWGLCKNHDFIYLYNGAFWANIDKEAFQKFLGEAAEKMNVPKYSAKYYQFREHLFKQFLSEAILPTPESDMEIVLINLQNGTFEISPQGTKLRPFDRSDFITYQLPFEYNPKATAPIFEKYLNRVLPDKELQRVVGEYLGYIFIKHGNRILKEEKALVLYGSGANGKSVLYEVVNALLGAENCSCFSLEELTDKNGYYRAMIANKLVNYASEINGKLQVDTFKRMVSGETLPARLPYGNPMQLKQYAKMIFNCNELPKDIEHTNAYFRRFLIIPFDVTIPENEQDKRLHSKIIEEELSGVFNWILEGLNRILEQKHFSNCEVVKKTIEQYKMESNSVELFLHEKEYNVSPTDYVFIKDLYPEYRSFCSEDGLTPFKKTNFIKQLKALGFTVERVTNNKLAVYIKIHEDNL
ncbi:MAG: DNA primase [Bacteroidales bacterium]|nr:DNA primase [Bacteroidales bacterium]